MDNKISFRARPQAIIAKLENVPLCYRQQKFAENVARFFNEIDLQMKNKPGKFDTFVYRLDEQTRIPERISRLEAEGKTLEKMDRILTFEKFSCQSRKCNGVPKKSIMQRILQTIGVDNPSSIEIG